MVIEVNRIRLRESAPPASARRRRLLLRPNLPRTTDKERGS